MMDEKQLKQFVSQIQSLDDEISERTKAKNELFKQLKDDGVNVKAVRHILKLVKLQKSILDEFDFEVQEMRKTLDI